MGRLHTNKKEAGPERGPYSLLLMGGDQVYADEIWETGSCPLLKVWSHLNEKDQLKAKVTPALAKEIENFYNTLYLNRWQNPNHPDMANMLASIPSIMMWDDHDIFDGWGSYPEERQNCAIYQKVFAEAARVFDIFQLRCSAGNRLNSQAEHRSLRLKFRDYHILVLDNRSERTLKQIMSASHWVDVKNYLAGLQNEEVKNLLILSGVPVVYRSFATVEKLFDTTPWHEELEDDVQDHWSATSHQAERMRFVMTFLKFLEEKRTQNKTVPRSVILSGDVHVGALGQVWDESRKIGLTQIISSGIVHPPPTALAWVGLKIMTSDTPEPLGEGDVVAEMLTPTGSDRYLRTRNYTALHLGSDQKLWVNWICEDEGIKPSFAIE
jgi:phosphodiesterase/alkaline phosphatase D-like protein